MDYIDINSIDFDKYKYIFLDIDGVVLQSIKTVCDILNIRYNKLYEPSDILTWNFSEFKYDMSSEEIEELFDSVRFFKLVQFYDGVIEFINEHKDKIICITKGNDKNIELKRKLFDSKGLNIPIIGIPLDYSKDIINMDGSIFIDDCKNNLTESNASVKILFRYIDNDNEWQRGWNGLYTKGWK